jgi:hypothetical protein
MPKFFGSKQDPKNQHYLKSGYSSEILKDSQGSSPPPANEIPKPSLFRLSGLLGLGQTVEINQPKDQSPSWGKEIFQSTGYLEREERALLEKRQKEIQKEIEELQEEIKKLIKVTEGFDHQVENAVEAQIVEFSEYQVRFFQRVRIFIANFRKNISEASIWLDSFTTKKKKRNCFWNTVKSKKGGGEQYLFSNEHSVARSAT